VHIKALLLTLEKKPDTSATLLTQEKYLQDNFADLSEDASAGQSSKHLTNFVVPRS